jgi:hypothetical protein
LRGAQYERLLLTTSWGYPRPMNPFTLAGFQDELEKIAAPNEATAGESPRIQEEKNNPSWQQKAGKEQGVQDQKPQSETPASKANAFFGLPVGQPRKRGTRDYDQGSAAASSPDRSQQPIDAQSSANISQGGAQYPSTGPGGV